MGNPVVIGIAGSPRSGGNSDILLEQALAGAEEAGASVERLFLRSMKISPCLGCRKCEQTGKCVQQDDMQSIYPKLLGADHIILSSPIFFYSVSSHAKIMIDRCQSLWASRYLLKNIVEDRRSRKGLFISIGATGGKKLFDGASLTVKYFFDVAGVAFADSLLVRNIDRKGAILEYSEILRQAREKGRGAVL